MSNYDQEQGQVVVSTADFAKFRKGLVQALNDHQEQLLAHAQAIHTSILATADAEKDQALETRIATRIHKLLEGKTVHDRLGSRQVAQISVEDGYRLHRALVGPRPSAQQERHLLRRPTADLFPIQPMPPADAPTRALVRARNAEQKALLGLARQVHAEVVAHGAPAPVATRVRAALDRLADQLPPGAAARQIFQALVKAKPAVLVRPTVKHFPLVKASLTSVLEGDVSLRLDPVTRTVHWRVENNNHAVKRAWESNLGQVFHRLLGQMTWTRGTGGHFRYSSEYDVEDSRDYGGSASHISRHVGPLGEQAYARETGSKPSHPPTPRRLRS